MAQTIRFAAETDATQMLDIYAPIVEDTAISFEEVPPSRPEMAGRIRSTLERYPWLTCEEAGQVLGYAYAAGFQSRPAYQWAVEVTAYVRPEAQRRGVASALYTSLFEILRLQGFSNALAAIALPNEASVALHERFGFKPVGVFQDVGFKLMRWHDVEWWALGLQQPRDPPRHPKAPARGVGGERGSHVHLKDSTPWRLPCDSLPRYRSPCRSNQPSSPLSLWARGLPRGCPRRVTTATP